MRTCGLANFVVALIAAMLLTRSALGAQSRAARCEKSLRWAERQLEKELRPPDGTHYGWLYGMQKAQGAFEAIIAKYGGSARAYVGVGECQVRLGNYAAALRSFTRAVKLAPRNRTARCGAGEARRSFQVALAVASQLPGHQGVLQVGRFTDRPDRDLWAVLSAEPTGDSGMWGQEYRAPRLALFQWLRPGYRKLWQSEELRDPRFKDSEWDQVALDVFNYTGDRVPEVAVWKQYDGASWDPCHLEIFKLNGSRLSRILSVTSDEDLQVEDLKHDGRYEVQNEYCVGLLPSHALQYRWHDIYTYDPTEGRYILADGAFPREFRDDTSGLLLVLKRYPGDPQLLEYLGIAREIEGRPGAALRAYRAAIISASWADEEGGDAPFSRAILIRREAALRARLAIHSRRRRADAAGELRWERWRGPG